MATLSRLSVSRRIPSRSYLQSPVLLIRPSTLRHRFFAVMPRTGRDQSRIAADPVARLSGRWRGFCQQAKASADAASSSTQSASTSAEDTKSNTTATDEAASKDATADGKIDADDTSDRKTDGDATGAGAENASGDKADADATGAAETDASPDAEAAAPTPEEELQKLEEQLRAKKHELLLAFADFENNKKKFTKERQNRRRNATINFARKMVEVYDEFEELARTPVPDEPSDADQALREGVTLTGDVYKSALERFDVSPIAPEPGEPFVALHHEDVGSTPSNDLAVGSVAELVQSGWRFKSEGSATAPTVLRRARVKLVAAA